MVCRRRDTHAARRLGSPFDHWPSVLCPCSSGSRTIKTALVSHLHWTWQCEWKLVEWRRWKCLGPARAIDLTYQRVEKWATYSDERSGEKEQGHQGNYLHGNGFRFGLSSDFVHVTGHDLHLLCWILGLCRQKSVRLRVLEFKQTIELLALASDSGANKRASDVEKPYL